MKSKTVIFREWEFEVNLELTRRTYAKLPIGDADACACAECKQYVKYRPFAFPAEIQTLFIDLGIDYSKEAEVFYSELSDKDFSVASGWFHFKGRIINGKRCRVKHPGSNGHFFDLTLMSPICKIGFDDGNDVAIFEEKSDLVQVEFQVVFPSVGSSAF